MLWELMSPVLATLMVTQWCFRGTAKGHLYIELLEAVLNSNGFYPFAVSLPTSSREWWSETSPVFPNSTARRLSQPVSLPSTWNALCTKPSQIYVARLCGDVESCVTYFDQFYSVWEDEVPCFLMSPHLKYQPFIDISWAVEHLNYKIQIKQKYPIPHAWHDWATFQAECSKM